MESILTSIKKLLGIPEDYAIFDVDIIIHINTVLFTLQQIGVGPVEGFSITTDEQTWSDFLGDDLQKLEAVKTYMYLKVKMAFDPSTSSFVLESYKRMADELEWRLNVKAETGV